MLGALGCVYASSEDVEQSVAAGADAVAAGRSVVKAREQADAIDRDLKAIAARAREAEARRAELEKAFKMQVRDCAWPRLCARARGLGCGVVVGGQQ